MAEYYTMETVRAQILQKGVVNPDVVSWFPLDWNLCPCVTVKRCERDDKISCAVNISIFFYVPHVSSFIIEIIYVRENHHGFVRANNMQLNKLIEKEIINRESLKRVSF
jgi:hypothetical protein